MTSAITDTRGAAVVDDEGRFLGLIPPQQLLGILLDEHDEDLVRLGGYLRATASARAASVESVPRRLLYRLPWLALGLVGAMLSAGLMAAFEGQLEANLLVAFFVPGIVYLPTPSAPRPRPWPSVVCRLVSA